jgi:hypothetical protein
MTAKNSVKVLVILFIAVLLSGYLTARAEPDNPDPGIPWGSYQITWRSDDGLHYKLKWIGEGCSIEIKADCTDESAPAPKVGDVCERVGNQKFDCPGKTQDLKWTETETQFCWAYFPLINKVVSEETPPCCTTCQICYEKGYVSNGKWVKTSDLGCKPFKEAPELPMLNKVFLSSPYEIKARVKCSQPLPAIKSWLEFVAGEVWKYIPMADGSGKVTCATLDYRTDTARWITQYEEYGCVCQTGALLADPGGIFTDTGE